MVIAGPCLYIDETDAKDIEHCAMVLKEYGGIDYFRVKIYGGGPNVEKYVAGIRDDGINLLAHIDTGILPTLTEIRTERQFDNVIPKLSGVWIGARNAQNYDLVEYCCNGTKTGTKLLMIKRHFGMTIDELIGLYDLCEKKFGKKIYVIERGIVTFDRDPVSRWSPDLKGIVRLKYERPDIFSRVVVDCSHSVFDRRFVGDIYTAFKSIGVEHFMFECTFTGKSRTYQSHMLSVLELGEMLELVK